MNETPADLEKVLSEFYAGDAAEADARRVLDRLQTADRAQAHPFRERYLVSAIAAALVLAAVGLAAALLARGTPQLDATKRIAGEDEKDKCEPKPAPQPEPTPEQRAKVDALLQKLNAQEYEVREKASAELEKLGPPAIPHLETLIQHEDPEVRTRAEALVRRIRRAMAFAALREVWPEAEHVLAIEAPDERQTAIVAWAKTAPKRRAAEALVLAAQYLEPGPALWGSWEALNSLAALEQFGNIQGGAWAGHHANGNSVWGVLSRRNVYPNDERCFRFGPKAEEIGRGSVVLDQNLSVTGRLMLANQLQRLKLGFVIAENGDVTILTPEEGARYWQEWWASVRESAEWSGEIEKPTRENMAHWIRALDSADLRVARRNVHRLIGHWNPDIEKLVTGRSTGTGAGAQRAQDVLTLIGLRGKGRILFNYHAPEGKMKLLTMNPDGSDVRPLLPEGEDPRRWWSIWNGCNGRKLLTDWNTQALYTLGPGEAAPQLVEAANAHSVSWSAHGRRLVYLRLNMKEGGPGRLRIFDLATRSQVPVPEFFNSHDVDGLACHAASNRLAYLCPERKGDWEGDRALWVCDLDSGKRTRVLDLPAAHQPTGYKPEWSPDGQYVLYASYTKQAGVYTPHMSLIETATGKIDNLAATHAFAQQPQWMPDGAKLAAWLKGEQGARERLAILTPGRRDLLRLETPEQAQSGWTQWLEGRLLVRGRNRSWLLELSSRGVASSKEIGAEIYLGDAQKFEHAGKAWLIVEADAVEGCPNRQIVLLAADGSELIPMTNLPGNASGPQWLEGE